MGESGCFQVLYCDFGMARLQFESDDETIARQCASKPERAISAERADLEHTPCTHCADEYFKELSLQSSDINSREIRLVIGVECRIEAIAGSYQSIGEILIDLPPDFLRFFGQGPASKERAS